MSKGFVKCFDPDEYEGLHRSPRVDHTELSETLRQEIAQLRRWNIQLTGVMDLLQTEHTDAVVSLEVLSEDIEQRAGDIEDVLTQNNLLSLFPNED